MRSLVLISFNFEEIQKYTKSTEPRNASIFFPEKEYLNYFRYF
ncbi:hypothetical protein NC99_21020 [Sunxiuqinia dokdonensis]|uniref:Uncharacterized protein n=1 Tax=Sunxiuqinia dokdonensis TaxID=1409788 RepID=A0A0L8V9T8_9BACT|nr:hypothetical protein NC99_21020 [Sunxiuqinia dokdonensis]